MTYAIWSQPSGPERLIFAFRRSLPAYQLELCGGLDLILVALHTAMSVMHLGR